ncbi:MAG: hypothetical protein ABIR36_07870 [Nitrospiraceae bacterium]
MPTTPTRHRIIHLLLIVFALGTGFSLWQSGAAHAGTTGVTERTVLLPDDRPVRGTVQDVKSGQIQVNIGELMPVFLSVDTAREKGDALAPAGR